MEKYGLVILAAGGSARMGSPKQLLKYKEQSLLNNIAHIAVELKNVIPLVVVGAKSELMIQDLSGIEIDIFVNKDWADGMSTSIKTGLAKIIDINPLIEACIFVVCDQPFVSLQLLQSLINKYEQAQKGIIACEYDGIIGTPVLLTKEYFTQLNLLTQEEGAKKIVKQNPNNLAIIKFINGEIDIDTKEDYKKLIDAFR